MDLHCFKWQYFLLPKAQLCSTAYTYSLFSLSICSYIYLGQCHTFFTFFVKKNTAVNMRVQLSLWHSFEFLCICVQKWDFWIIHELYLRNIHTVFFAVVLIYILLTIRETSRSPLFTSTCPWFFKIANQVVRWYLTYLEVLGLMILICIYLMINDAEHFFTDLLVISFWELPMQILCYIFFLQSMYFLALNWVIYIFWTLTPYKMYGF